VVLGAPPFQRKLFAETMGQWSSPKKTGGRE
jgi:hypothetical protein